MEIIKKIYTYKSVYYSIFIFSFLVVIYYGYGLIRNINEFSNYSYLNWLFLTQTIFNLVIFIISIICLSANYKKSVFINNIGYISLIVVVIQNILMFIFTKYRIGNSLTMAFVILAIILFMMFLNNYFKEKIKYFEIEEIGSTNNKI